MEGIEQTDQRTCAADRPPPFNSHEQEVPKSSSPTAPANPQAAPSVIDLGAFFCPYPSQPKGVSRVHRNRHRSVRLARSHPAPASAPSATGRATMLAFSDREAIAQVGRPGAARAASSSASRRSSPRSARTTSCTRSCSSSSSSRATRSRPSTRSSASPCSCTLWGEPDARFGSPAFAPSWELLEEHPRFYEIVYILSDDGFGVEVFVPKRADVPQELLAMCAAYATPAPEDT